ncbi:MAG: hypothetical protein ACLSVD_04740 [Eggerthellaceae bacterium]
MELLGDDPAHRRELGAAGSRSRWRTPRAMPHKPLRALPRAPCAVFVTGLVNRLPANDAVDDKFTIHRRVALERDARCSWTCCPVRRTRCCMHAVRARPLENTAFTKVQTSRVFVRDGDFARAPGVRALTDEVLFPHPTRSRAAHEVLYASSTLYPPTV